MKIEDIELCASYWTVSGAVYPGAPSEISPVPPQERAEVSGRVGWRGMGFVLDDMEASIAQYGLPTVSRIFSDNGIRHVELEFLVDWHLDGDRRRASEAMYERMLEIGAELGVKKIKLGGGVFEEGEPDLPAMRTALAAICERAAPLGIDIVIEFLPFASINSIDRGLALFDGLGMTNGGLLVDTWHIERGGMTADDIRKIPLNLLRAVELNDADRRCWARSSTTPPITGAFAAKARSTSPPNPGHPRCRLPGLLGRRADFGGASPSAARDRGPAGVRHDDEAVQRRQPARGLSRHRPWRDAPRRTKQRGNTRWSELQFLAPGASARSMPPAWPRTPRRSSSPSPIPFPRRSSRWRKSLGAEAMIDPMAAIARPDVDAVVIGTPTDTHVALLLKAVELGKAVLCEKPIDLDMAKSESAAAEVERVGGRVMMAFNRRFDSTFAEMRRAIDAGRIGEVRQVIISSRDPGHATARPM